MSVVFRTLTVLVIAIMAGWAWGQAVPPTGELLQMLHAGGYVIVVRHGATNADQADTDPPEHRQHLQATPVERQGPG